MDQSESMDKPIKDKEYLINITYLKLSADFNSLY